MYLTALVCIDVCTCEIQPPFLWYIPTLKRPWNKWGSDTHHLQMISVKFGTFTYLKAQSGRSDRTHAKAISRRSTSAPLRCPISKESTLQKRERGKVKKYHLLILCKCIIHFSLLSCDKNG